MSDDNPLMRRAAMRAKGDHGRKSEANLSKRLGAQQVPASGAMEGAKSDLVKRNWRIEAKSTVNDSLSLKLDWLLKIRQEALETNRTPALAVTFVTPLGKPVPGGKWVLVPEYVFKELTDGDC